MAKKLYGKDAQTFKKWVNQGAETIIDIDGQRYLIQALQESRVKIEIESDPELREMIKRADKDIENGNLFNTEDILEAIERGEI
ncbi:hypothetical protein [Alkalihalobacterium sp. APHAB7]|uniref:hypothetical protein n=1 Tax=Alkalihalobacterium sp. APHAB7 TaxID=3402081 RepID=UPI003AAF605A